MMAAMSSLTAACSHSALAILAAAGLAQPPPGGQGEFVPLSQLRPTEQLPAAPLLIAGYAFVWVAVTLYLWSIRRRLDRVEADMQALERRTTQAEHQTKSAR
jgi:CcmD family protein